MLFDVGCLLLVVFRGACVCVVSMLLSVVAALLSVGVCCEFVVVC